eukprot:TRINITY_DN10796_c1_g1_i1.p1 TRINITY_DN10796_c1_g1~~TRINITY_DN10796_c1_g1_i1.p1  ORF type:complete len:224 (-),score=115.87 TRINITY_DN10796_c1_g1_i1:117-788(-)
MSAKLTYFDGRGLSEGIRLLLAFTDVEYTERDIETLEEWLELKPTLKFAQLPLLEIDGKRLFQSRAIEQYLARKANLLGKNADEQYEVDSYLESISDFKNASPGRAVITKEEGYEAKIETFLNGAGKKLLTIWDSDLEKNGSLHLVGSDYTYADIALFNTLRTHVDVAVLSNLLDGYEHLKKFYAALLAHPKIQKHINGPTNFAYPPTPEYMAKIRSVLYSGK